MRKSITKSIFWYLQGNSRYKICSTRILKYLVPKYIREQISIRENSVDIICKTNGSCKECGCAIPQLQYADTNCNAHCYPHMLDKTTFTLLKNGGCYEDHITNLTWRITDGKFHYNNPTRGSKRKT